MFTGTRIIQQYAKGTLSKQNRFLPADAIRRIGRIMELCTEQKNICRVAGGRGQCMQNEYNTVQASLTVPVTAQDVICVQAVA